MPRLISVFEELYCCILAGLTGPDERYTPTARELVCPAPDCGTCNIAGAELEVVPMPVFPTEAVVIAKLLVVFPALKTRRTL